MGSLGFAWVHLGGSRRLGIEWVILGDNLTDTELLQCTEILSDLITVERAATPHLDLLSNCKKGWPLIIGWQFEDGLYLMTLKQI